MSQLYYFTEPPQKNIQKPTSNLRSLMKMKRSVPIKLDPIINLNRTKEEKLGKIHEELGSPRNTYVLKKIQEIMNPFSPKSNSKQIKKSSRYEEATQSIFLGSSIKSYQKARAKTDPNIQEEDYDRAIMKNKQQRIDRLLNRHKESQQNYQKMSRNLKAKSQLKVIDPKIKNPLHMEDKTWYKKWFQESVKQKNRILVNRHRTFELKLNRQKSQTMHINSLIKGQ